MSSRFPGAICIAIALFSLPGIAQIEPDQSKIDARNSRIMEEIMLRTSAAGMSAAIGKDGDVVWAEGIGYANLELAVPVTEETLFRIGSVSKPLSATAVGLLVQEGKLDLDVPIQTYLPDFPEKRWPITTRQVAKHIAGIRHYRGDEMFSSKRYETVTEGLEIFKHDTLLFEPGYRFSYSSYGWNLVSAVVEVAAGVPFLEYMQTEVFDRIGLRHTKADWMDRIIPNRTAFYEMRDDGRVYNAPFVDNSYKWAGGGFIATPSDLVRFGMAYADRTFLSEETVEELWEPHVFSNGNSTNYGIGWGSGVDSRGRRIVEHGGGSVGGTTMFICWPDDNVCGAIVSNSGGPTTPQAVEALAEPYLTPVFREDSEVDVTGEYTCVYGPPHEKRANLVLSLMGSRDNYWGGVDDGNGHWDIIETRVDDREMHLIAVMDQGWMTHLRFDLSDEEIEGYRDAVEMACVRER